MQDTARSRFGVEPENITAASRRLYGQVDYFIVGDPSLQTTINLRVHGFKGQVAVKPIAPLSVPTARMATTRTEAGTRRHP